MRNLIPLLFLAIFLPEYLYSLGLVPRLFMYLPELLSIVALGLVVLLVVKNRAIHLEPKYLLLFALIVLHILFGAIINHVETTTVFTGLRTYFKYLPFFLLPIVHEYTDKEIRTQFGWLLVYSAIQLPVALYQRFVLSAEMVSGDWVSGTLGGGGLKGSGLLTVYLMCAVSVLIAFYLRNRVSRLQMIAMLLVLVLPTMLNETKVTVILLPIAVLVPAFFTDERTSEKIGRVLGMGVLALALFGLFALGYNQFYGQREGHGIVKFFTTEGRLEASLLKGERLIEQGKVGRLDALVLPLTILPEDPVELMFGLGISNVSDSFFGNKFAGAYFDKYGSYTQGSMSVILWELGLIGISLLLLFFYLVFLDAVYLKSMRGIMGDVALGWTGVVFIITLTLFYTDLMSSNAISYIFWFYSGYVISMASRAKQIALMNNQTWK